jgi:integrase/recombinase XerD
MNTFNLLIAKFQEYMRVKDFSQRTIKGYTSQLGFFIKYLQTLKIDQVNQITKEIIYNYQLSLLTQEKPISLETQLARLVALKSFFRYLAKTNQILQDPTIDLELPRTKKNLPRDIMTKKEVFRLLNQPDPDNPLGLRDKAILELLYSTGIRNQELRQLTLYDVDTTNNDLRINQGKGKKDRVVPLGEIAANYIEEYIKYARPKLSTNQETNILFLTKNGKPINHSNLIWTVRKYVKKAGFTKNITPHSLRHTCATHLLKNKASLRHIQELLGHSSIETTQVYTQLELTDLKKAHKLYHPREKER